MPKITIDKYAKFLFMKDNIWLSSDLAIIKNIRN